MYYILKQGGTHSPSLLYLAVDLCEWCLADHICLTALDIASHDNNLDDLLNHTNSQAHEWELDQSVFLHLCEWWGKPALDLFTSEVQTILLLSWHWQTFLRRCIRQPMAQDPHLPFSAVPTSPQGCGSPITRQTQCHRYSPLVAGTTLVFSPSQSLIRHSPPVSPAPPPHIEQCPSTPPKLTCTAPGSMEDSALLMNVLCQSKKPSTRKAYLYKWNRFKSFTESSSLPSINPSLATVLCFSLHLKSSSFSLPSLRVYLSTIVSYQPPNSLDFFKHPTLKHFLKGLSHIYLDTCPSSPQLSLTLVLQQLTKAPFESLASTDLQLLTFKTVFLVAITSAERASELAALRHDYPYLQFFPG
ncbi:uncharacterized protein LOC144588279 [Pogona vitticeps]